MHWYHSQERVNRAREHEAKSEWREAATIWKSIGNDVYAQACEGIADACEIGYAWRAEPEPRPDFRVFALAYKDGVLAARFLR